MTKRGHRPLDITVSDKKKQRPPFNVLHTLTPQMSLHTEIYCWVCQIHYHFQQVKRNNNEQRHVTKIPSFSDKDIYSYLVLTMKCKSQMMSKKYYEDGHSVE